MNVYACGFHAEMCCANLRQRGLDALAHGQGSREHGNSTGWENLDSGRLIGAATGWFDGISQALAQITALSKGRLSSLFKTVAVHRLLCHGLHAGKVSAVDNQWYTRSGFQRLGVGDFGGRNQVQFAAADRVHADMLREPVH